MPVTTLSSPQPQRAAIIVLAPNQILPYARVTILVKPATQLATFAFVCMSFGHFVWFVIVLMKTASAILHVPLLVELNYLKLTKNEACASKN